MLFFDDPANNLEKRSNQHPTRFFGAIFRPLGWKMALSERHIPLSSSGPHSDIPLAPQILHTGRSKALKIDRKLNAGTVNTLSAPKLRTHGMPSSDSDAREIMRHFCITFISCDSEDSHWRTDENACGNSLGLHLLNPQCAATKRCLGSLAYVAICLES